MSDSRTGQAQRSTHTSDADEQVILVEANDTPVGVGGKLDVHRLGLLHRAFSIFLVDRTGALLLQKRSCGKYHSGGLWANSCCGHPRPGEEIQNAAVRRLREELGASARLRFGFVTSYRAELDNGLVENEVVHVFFGQLGGRTQINPAEVSEIQFLAPPTLIADVAQTPSRYAAWLRHYVDNCGPQLAINLARIERDDKR